jgi:Tfp pilus assembly protein PilP
MRFVKPSATLIAALALCVASGPAAFAQAKPAPAQPAPSKAPAKVVAKQPAAKAPAQTAAKKPAAKATTKATTQVATAQASAPASRRDPFQPLISKTDTGKGVPENLPPGPGGLMVSTLRLEGIVRAPSGMIAVISNPQQRVYFVREGAALYDGTLEKISLDSVTFRERGKDPFGKSVDRPVVKRLYPRAGEQ